MKYLIFDFDGVIGDTREASAKATAQVEHIGLEQARAGNDKYARNKPSHVRNHTLSEDELHKIYVWTSQFGEFMNESEFPLFTDFIAEIEKIDTPFKAIVSSGSQKYVIPSLAKTNIAPTHILAYENHHSKEEKIETICADWGIDVSEVYYFTDTLADVYELRDMISEDKLIGVSWGYCSFVELAKVLDEKYILKQPEDIHNVLSYA